LTCARRITSGNAEGAADLDQLAARDDRFLALGQRVQRQQHGGGVVVDDGRGDVGIAAGNQFGEQAGHQVVAVAAPARGEVVFQRTGRTRRLDHPRDGLLGQQGAAEVGVQDGAGQVEHGTQIGPASLVGTAADGGEQRRFIGQRQAVLEALAGGGQFGADAAGDQLPAVRFDQFRNLA
jgi:hypothetical protein